MRNSRFQRNMALLACLQGLAACGDPPNNPYPALDNGRNILYASFEERPKHLDPARAYSANEYEIIAQVYEPPLQYAYLKRPYQLEPLTASRLPEVSYLDSEGRPLPPDAPAGQIAYSLYDIHLKPGIRYQPHPAFVTDGLGHYRYHALTPTRLEGVHGLADFPETATRTLTAADYVYQIKRLVHPEIHSPIGELMSGYIVGLQDLGTRLTQAEAGRQPSGWLDLRLFAVEGLEIIDDLHFRIRIKGKYPQFRFWLAMPFFAPMPWEVDAFYAQPGLTEKNISLDWRPVGTGPFMLTENNPNRRMVLDRNPVFHGEAYPSEGETSDGRDGYLADTGKPLPFVDRIVFVLEKEIIPYWNKFLQGYYDASGLASDNFEQAIQFGSSGSAELTPDMASKGIRLQTAVTASSAYLGFNMLDPVVGGLDESRSLLRRAISIAIDEEEFVAIFMNGRGQAAHGILPPGLFGFEEGQNGINTQVYDWLDGRVQRKDIGEARRMLADAGYPQGMDPRTGNALTLFLDTTASGVDDKALLDWYRKQFQKLGIQLVPRTTDYNQFQQKMANGNAQIFRWGWNADYPDPENFMFLLFGENTKVGKGGENAANYQNPEYDRLFMEMRHMDDGPGRLERIRRMQEIIRHDSPWVFGVHPTSFTLHHAWQYNFKPNLMANNGYKYLRIDAAQRRTLRSQWNQPRYWPLGAGLLLASLAIVLTRRLYRRRLDVTVR